MNTLRNKFNKYGLGEWIVFVLGVIILITQTVRYITNTLDGSVLDLVVFSSAFLCLFAPKALISIIKKKSE